MLGRLNQLDYSRQVLIIYVFAIFMTVLDGTMVNVALKTMAVDFSVAETDVEWIAVGYLVAVAIVIPAAGWMGDRFGSRRVFLTSLIAFTVASAACGLAQTLDQLVVLRVVQGLGGGLMAPIGAAMLYRAFPMSQRATASAAVMSVAVVAPAIGPALGGALVDYASWRWIFLINVPIGIAALAAGRAVLRDDDIDARSTAGRFDVVGFALVGGSMAVLLYAMTIGPEQGWTSRRVAGMVLVGVVALGLGIFNELRIRTPMLKLSLFRDGVFRNVNLASALLYAGFFGMIVALPLFLQSVRGESAVVTGLLVSPQAIGILIVSNTFGPRWYRRFGPRRLITVGAPIAGLITMAFVMIGQTTSLVWMLVLALARGLVMGVVFICIQTGVYATTSAADTGRATSLFNSVRQFAYAGGVALAATVLAAGLHGGESADKLAAYHRVFVVLGAVMIPAALFSAQISDRAVAATRGRTA